MPAPGVLDPSCVAVAAVGAGAVGASAVGAGAVGVGKTAGVGVTSAENGPPDAPGATPTGVVSLNRAKVEPEAMAAVRMAVRRIALNSRGSERAPSRGPPGRGAHETGSVCWGGGGHAPARGGWGCGAHGAIAGRSAGAHASSGAGGCRSGSCGSIGASWRSNVGHRHERSVIDDANAVQRHARADPGHGSVRAGTRSAVSRCRPPRDRAGRRCSRWSAACRSGCARSTTRPRRARPGRPS